MHLQSLPLRGMKILSLLITFKWLNHWTITEDPLERKQASEKTAWLVCFGRHTVELAVVEKQQTGFSYGNRKKRLLPREEELWGLIVARKWRKLWTGSDANSGQEVVLVENQKQQVPQPFRDLWESGWWSRRVICKAPAQHHNAEDWRRSWSWESIYFTVGTLSLWSQADHLTFWHIFLLICKIGIITESSSWCC